MSSEISSAISNAVNNYKQMPKASRMKFLLNLLETEENFIQKSKLQTEGTNVQIGATTRTLPGNTAPTTLTFHSNTINFQIWSAFDIEYLLELMNEFDLKIIAGTLIEPTGSCYSNYQHFSDLSDILRLNFFRDNGHNKYYLFLEMSDVDIYVLENKIKAKNVL